MLLPFIFIFLVFLNFANAGDTTCARIDARWNNADGLNPCEVYQRLRQLCDSTYEVPALSLDGPNRPTDRCSDGSPCCCNSVAFQLSMLCLNCQRGTEGTKAQGTGALSGSYQSYISSCPPDSDSVTSSVQAQICNSSPALDVPSYLYRYMEDDPNRTGEWSEDKLSVDFASSESSSCSNLYNGNGDTSGSASADGPVETTNTRTWGPVPAQVAYTRTQTPYKTRALIGGILGGSIALVAIVAAGIAVWLNRREKKRRLQFEASQAPEMAETQPLRSQRPRPKAPRTERSQPPISGPSNSNGRGTESEALPVKSRAQPRERAPRPAKPSRTRDHRPAVDSDKATIGHESNSRDDTAVREEPVVEGDPPAPATVETRPEEADGANRRTAQ